MTYFFHAAGSAPLGTRLYTNFLKLLIFFQQPLLSGERDGDGTLLGAIGIRRLFATPDTVFHRTIESQLYNFGEIDLHMACLIRWTGDGHRREETCKQKLN